MKHQVVNVTEFKAKCLALLDGIGERGGYDYDHKAWPAARQRGTRAALRMENPQGAWAGMDQRANRPDLVIRPAPGRGNFQSVQIQGPLYPVAQFVYKGLPLTLF